MFKDDGTRLDRRLPEHSPRRSNDMRDSLVRWSTSSFVRQLQYTRDALLLQLYSRLEYDVPDRKQTDFH
jgi:hypothetical protein